MPGEPAALSLRAATRADCDQIWQWRNDPETRRSSFDEREIPLAEHRTWFEATLARPDRRFYIIVLEGTDVGMIRLDRQGADAIVNVNLAPEWRGRGVGRAALRTLVEGAFAEPGLRRLVARMKRLNVGSRRAFEAAGFQLVDGNDPLTFVAVAPGQAAGPSLASSVRLESLWRGSFGREYTDRNAVKGARRWTFWNELLSTIKVASVLEVGCNLGANLKWIRPRVPTAIGVDVNEYPLPRLRETVPGVGVSVAVARALPFRDGAFDLVFTMGVLIHHAPDLLPLAMREIVRCSRRYVLCGEYFAETLTEVSYRGHAGALFKQDFGARYQELFPGLKLLERGRLLDEDGWDDDEVTFWLFEKAAAGP